MSGASRSMLYLSLSAASGVMWGGLGFVLLHDAVLSAVWGGLYASPVIGLMIGAVFMRAGRLPPLARIFLSLLSLYIAASLFGLAVGVYDAYFRDIPDRITSEVIIQAVIAVLWGLTLAGWFAILWPLSFLNHTLLWRVTRS